MFRRLRQSLRRARGLAEKSDRAMVAGAAARAKEMVERPGTLAPPLSAFGQVAAVMAAQDAEDP